MFQIFCPLCAKVLRSNGIVSAEVQFAGHVLSEHTPEEIHRALNPCSGCSGEYTEDPKPYLALILQDEGPARWTPVAYCQECFDHITTSEPDIVELVPHTSVFVSAH